MILIIDKKCTRLSYAAGVLKLHREGETTRSIAVTMLEQVIVYGNALVESSVYRALAAAGVPATLLASRGNQASAYLSAGLATQLPIRRAQHRCADSNDARLSLAKEIVRLKLQSYSVPIAMLVSLNISENETALFLQRCADSHNTLTAASNVASVLGIEGSIAQMWFVLLSRAIPMDFKFSGRNRRPPRDPVNALLSLGYTLLHADILKAVQAAGMDPSLGFLHSDYPGRSSLVLDMCEPLRSGVDLLVLQLISKRMLTPEHFYYRNTTGCRLNKKARPIFFQAWANHRTQWPRPANPENACPWPGANVTGIANGQLQKMRELINRYDNPPEPQGEIDNIKFEELEDDTA